MHALIILGAVSGATLALLLLLTVLRLGPPIWPLPMGAGVRSLAFWALFRLFNASALITLAISGFSRGLAGDAALGVLRGLGGFVAGLSALLFVVAGLRLGRDALYGRGGGLEADGLYRASRNPQYTAAIAGYAGAALFAWSLPGAFLAALAVAIYVLMAYAEEPWLALRYGPEYDRYARGVPRFIGVRSLLALGLASYGTQVMQDLLRARPGRGDLGADGRRATSRFTTRRRRSRAN